MAATDWPIKIADLGELVLDPRNVRVREGRGDGLTRAAREAAEKAIAKYMLEAENLLDLTRDILRDGYLDNEIPVVTPEGGGMVVLEGNRRITALKVIEKPDLLGAGAARVEKLINRYPDHGSPTKIRIMISPSREAAQPLLARLHTGTPKKGWIREQQAIFFHAQLSADTSVDDLRVTYPAEAGGIPRFIAMGEMREVIRAMRYDDTKLREFVMDSGLKMTGFEYAYRPKKLHTALGLEFTRDGLLVSKRLSDGQRRALMYLLGRFRAGTLNTRSPELIAKYPQHDQFAEMLRRIVAGEQEPPQVDGNTGAPGGQPGHESGGTSAGRTDRVGGGAGSSDTESNEGASSGTAGVGTSDNGSRGSNRGETKSRLNMDGFEYQGTSAGLRRRFEEVRRLDVRDFPNAAHDLLRTVLECAIKDFFRAKKQPLQPKQTVGPCIEALAREFQKNPKMTALINAINRRGRMSAEQYAGTADSLSASNHEPDHFADPRDVHAAWERIKPILIEIVGTASSS